MSGLCVSVAKNSTKLQRLLLSVRVNSSTELEIAKIINLSPEFQILRSLSKRLGFQCLGLMKNIANRWDFALVVFPNKPSLFAVIPEALLAIESLAQKCHEIAVYLTTRTLEGVSQTIDKNGQPCLLDPRSPTTFSDEGCPFLSSIGPGDIERERVTLQGKSKFATTYYPYFSYENVRSRWLCRRTMSATMLTHIFIPQFSTQGTLSELTVQHQS